VEAAGGVFDGLGVWILPVWRTLANPEKEEALNFKLAIQPLSENSKPPPLISRRSKLTRKCKFSS